MRPCREKPRFGRLRVDAIDKKASDCIKVRLENTIRNFMKKMFVDFLNVVIFSVTDKAYILLICVSMIDSVCPRTYSSGGPIETLVCCLSVGARAHRVPRGSKLFWVLPRRS